MCMYYSERFIAEEDIKCWVVFKKSWLPWKRTLRRNKLYIPAEGKIITSKTAPVIGKKGKIYKGGIYSYTHWCPSYDPALEVWECIIPAGSMVYKNSWEYVSKTLKYVTKES